jgi:acyl-CoA thioesterase
MDWMTSTTVEHLGEGRFRAHVGEEWTSLQGVHGGVVAAIIVTSSSALLAERGVGPGATVRSATFGYVSGNVVGDLEITIDVVRRGRAMTTTHATVTQNGKTTTVARLHHSEPWEGMDYSDVPAPTAIHGDAVRLEFPPPAHLNNVETHLHPASVVFGGADRSEWIAWARPLTGDTFDTAWLAMFGDYFPPAVFTRSTEPVRAVTIEYSIQIHSGAGSWTLHDGKHLAARMHAFHSHDGFAVEDGWIHLPDGTLLATVRQSRLAG